ncbi:MAG: hypothetical protein JNJ54_30085 [Myxococcaceae bacterium]|nr:hypothetical protein [Myxococcaceae bacterium]
MRTLVCSTCLLLACVTGSADVRARAKALEQDAPACPSFVEFEQVLARERRALDAAPGADLVPASQALSNARKRCAQATIDGLFERQQRSGRGAAAAEVEALARALGRDEAVRVLRARWGADADGFLGELESAAFSPGPTPAQPPPQEPVSPAHTPEPPGADAFGEGAACLRRPSAEAARCVADWRRDGAEEQELDAAVARLVARVRQETKLLDDEGRAALLGDVLRGLALPRERAVLAPLFADLAKLTDVLAKRAEGLSARGQPERAAALVRPLLLVDESRRRVEPFALEASQKHVTLATEAKQRAHAAQLHRWFAAWFLGKDAPLPALDVSAWSVASWVCQLPQPALPRLPAGMGGRLVGRCRQLPKPEQRELDPALRTFDLEASLPRVRVDVDVTLTCGGRTTTKRLTTDEVLVEQGLTPDVESTRPGVLDTQVVTLVGSAEKACAATVADEAARECQRLDGDPLDVTQSFTRHALRLSAWPACFQTWFLQRYGVPLPALR